MMDATEGNANVKRHRHDFPYGHGGARCGFGMTTEEHRADEDARDVREHEAGEHAEAIVVDCYRCREDAEDLGMGDRLPDPTCSVCGEQVEDAGYHADTAGHWPKATADAAPAESDPFEEWREALIEYGAGKINGVMYRAVRERALLVVEAREMRAVTR